jgi:GNAT superfamily N-acetyltransferase
VEARSLTKADFDAIVEIIDSWWGGATRNLVHPIYFYELGAMSRVVIEDDKLVGFVFGFLAPHDPPVGYVHVVGVHPDYRRRGVGKFVHDFFEEECRRHGASMIKAITAVGDEGSVSFYRNIGWDITEVADYAGPGRPRIVFSKHLRLARPSALTSPAHPPGCASTTARAILCARDRGRG